jgi:hypothetical protein
MFLSSWPRYNYVYVRISSIATQHFSHGEIVITFGHVGKTYPKQSNIYNLYRYMGDSLKLIQSNPGDYFCLARLPTIGSPTKSAACTGFMRRWGEMTTCPCLQILLIGAAMAHTKCGSGADRTYGSAACGAMWSGRGMGASSNADAADLELSTMARCSRRRSCAPLLRHAWAFYFASYGCVRWVSRTVPATHRRADS